MSCAKMEVGMEDDVFFADISKQISLLIMDDDERPIAHSPSVSFQGFSQAIHPNTQLPVIYEQSWRRESKGTGVFIPRSAYPRRKNKQGKFTSSSNTNFHRHPNNSRAPSHVPRNTPISN